MERVCDGEEEEEKEGPRPCEKTYLSLQFGSQEHNIIFPIYLLQINFFHTSSCSIGRVDHLR